jgi:ubiquinone/menaquinone biosynthesis C-methylase UbiE
MSAYMSAYMSDRKTGVWLAAVALTFGVSACRPAVERVAMGNGATGVAVGTDTIGPAAAGGAPASAFPAPSREVADIVAPRWTDEDDRDDAGEFATVARLARIRSGQAVADIGAGDGYYVARLSPLVGGAGVVYGQDIVPDYLALLQRRVERDRLANVKVVLGDEHDPRLPPASVDVALMIHMYHEISQPFALLWNLASSMKPGGTLVILDLERPTYGHGTPPALLDCELTRVGYRRRSFTRTGPEEYVTIYVAPTAGERPTPATITASLAARPCRAS